MREFSMAQAWAHGIRFFSGQAVNQAIILIGVGVLLPALLQYGVAGYALGVTDPGTEMPATGGKLALALAVLVTAALLPVVSFAASWRLGSSRGAGLPSALAFGALAGPAATISALVLIGLVAFGLAQLATPLGVIFAVLAFLFVATIAFTTLAAFMFVSLSVLLGIAMITGAAVGNLGMAATLFGGGSGFIVVAIIVISGILLWVTGRLSCTLALMIERNSLDLFAAMAESWRMTWEDEWRIMQYLLLVGLALALLAVAVVAAFGVGIAALQGAEFSDQGPASPEQLGVLIFLQILAGSLGSYFAVMIPAGIHRELGGAPVPVEVFA